MVEVDELFAVIGTRVSGVGARSVEIARDQGSARSHLERPQGCLLRPWAASRRTTTFWDGVVPAMKLPEVLSPHPRSVAALDRVRIGNVFHAGDGNLHPLICCDGQSGSGGARRRVASEILHYCIGRAGAITGEHSVRLRQEDLHVRYVLRLWISTPCNSLRCAFDPTNICNPGKVFPYAATVVRFLVRIGSTPSNVSDWRARLMPLASFTPADAETTMAAMLRRGGRRRHRHRAQGTEQAAAPRDGHGHHAALDRRFVDGARALRRRPGGHRHRPAGLRFMTSACGAGPRASVDSTDPPHSDTATIGGIVACNDSRSTASASAPLAISSSESRSPSRTAKWCTRADVS